jgi:hypothetical protein
MRARVVWATLTTLVVSGPALAAEVTKPHPGLVLARTPGDALVVADLCAAGVSVRATRYDERQATPTQWAQKPSVGAEAAVNADFFDFPGWSLVNGRARGAGEDWPADKQLFETRLYWQFGPRLAQLITDASIPPAPAPAVTEIVGGHNLIIAAGKSLAPGFDGDGVLVGAYRRTAIGLSADRRFLYLFVSSAPLTGAGLADAMLARAGDAGFPQLDVATNVDGGGSSQMYVGAVGPMFATGRQVNNHLGVLAKGAGTPTSCPFPAPTGSLDRAGCDFIEGWTQAPADPKRSISGVLTYDARVFGEGAQYQPFVADVSRPDLCKALGSCEHAFAAPTPYGAMDGKPHPVFAYGLNPVEGAPAAELGGAPKTLTCAPPKVAGVKRWVVDEPTYAAWKFSGWIDLARVTDAALAALPVDADVATGPDLVLGDDGSPMIWLLDRGTKRHVPSPAAFHAWHFDMGKVRRMPAAELAKLPTGTPLRARPTLAQASEAKIWLVDDPRLPPPPTIDAGVSADATVDAGAPAAEPSDGPFVGSGFCGVLRRPRADATASPALLVACALACRALRRRQDGGAR